MVDYTPYTPSYPSVAPTAPQFNYQPPSSSLQGILGGLKGTGSTFGLPWAPGYTAQPGITTPMGKGVGPLNPAGVNPHPFGPGMGGGGAPAAPAAPQGQMVDPAMAQKLAMVNSARQKFNLPPLTPGTPEYQQWMWNQNKQGTAPWGAERAGGGIGNAGPPSGGGGAYGNDASGGSMGGHL